MPQDHAQIPPPTPSQPPARQRRNVDFAEQMAKKCRLRQDLEVQER